MVHVCLVCPFCSICHAQMVHVYLVCPFCSICHAEIVHAYLVCPLCRIYQRVYSLSVAALSPVSYVSALECFMCGWHVLLVKVTSISIPFDLALLCLLYLERRPELTNLMSVGRHTSASYPELIRTIKREWSICWVTRMFVFFVVKPQSCCVNIPF